MALMTKTKRPTASAVEGETKAVEAEISRLESEIRAATEELAEGEARHDDLLLKQNTVGVAAGGELERLAGRMAELRALIAERQGQLDERRRYLSTLRRPLLMAEFEAADKAARKSVREFGEHERACLSAFVEYLTQLQGWQAWNRDARRLLRERNALARQLGEPEMNDPRTLAIPPRLRPAPTLIFGDERRPDAYGRVIALLQIALGATEREINDAWATDPDDKTVAQRVITASWPAPAARPA